MNYFLIKIATRYAGYSLIVWALLFLFDILVSKLMSTPVNFFTSPMGILGAVFMSITAMNMTRWPLFWRRSSGSISQFWLGILAVLFFNLVFNGASYYLIISVFPGKDVTSMAFASTKLDLVWIAILTYLYSLVSLFDQKAMLANNALKPGKQVLLLLGIYVIIAVFSVLVYYSRLLGYSFTTVVLLMTLMLRNSFIVSSLQRTLRFQILAILIGSVFVISFISYKVEILSVAGYSEFLGKLGPDVVWNYSDLQNVKKPSDWINWWKAGVKKHDKLTDEEKIAALEKLEEVCPATATDNPAKIECREKDIESMDTIIYGGSDENSLLVQLASSYVYVRLLGILSARHVKEKSAGLKSALERISNSPGRLGPVAENTLARTRKNRTGITVVVIPE